MYKSLVALGVALSLCSSAALAERSIVHPFYAAQAENAPHDVHMAIEIPAGSYTKYEINDEGLVFVDRFQSMPVVYPANYGSLSRTLAGDGDPLDGLVLTRAPLHPGVLIKFRPIGYLKMIDGGEADEKIIGVPSSDIDPSYDNILDIDDLPSIERQRIEAFFRVYKQLPEGRKKVELDGYGNAEEARQLIQQALDGFKAKAGA
ncbi:inorganic diphosphatase [Pseudomonas sp. NCCP-436]|uniref:inorganic diphosphatase n=1 Tax=Pseudomonas sp. NCCP-436 TaxID=2842481 RepID=UPI001C80BD54|nr:inorganic diphosphatase [Pseudomonas sp. NCCP-436]GIZ11512.1 inorganic pyrophosphatase [Pseudomonas sp. NCCP-436]